MTPAYYADYAAHAALAATYDAAHYAYYAAALAATYAAHYARATADAAKACAEEE